ncbi:MAG: TadE/TadG family type IV pilus assembly protein [Candidatus Acidiferrales bacterium]
MMGKTFNLDGTDWKRRVHGRFAQRGQSLLEMAVLIPVVLLLLVGIIEIGRFAYVSIEVTNAARAAVQYGAQSLADAQDSAGLQQAAVRDAADLSSITVNSSALCACSDTPATFVPCPALGCAGHPVVFVQVDTTTSISPLFHYPGLPSSFTANGHAIMRVAQ